MAAFPQVQAIRSNRKKKSSPLESIRFVAFDAFLEGLSFIIPSSMSTVLFTKFLTDGQEAFESMIACCRSFIKPEIFLKPMIGRPQMKEQILQRT